MKKLSEATVDGIQEWGKAPTWDVKCPKIVGIQDKEDDNIFIIEKRTYSGYGIWLSTDILGTCEKALISHKEARDDKK